MLTSDAPRVHRSCSCHLLPGTAVLVLVSSGRGLAFVASTIFTSTRWPSLSGSWLLEGDANRQDAGVGRAAGVFGTDSAGDEAVGDFLDSSLPGLAGVALGGDRDGASGFAARDVKRIDLGLDT